MSSTPTLCLQCQAVWIFAPRTLCDICTEHNAQVMAARRKRERKPEHE